MNSRNISIFILILGVGIAVGYVIGVGRTTKGQSLASDIEVRQSDSSFHFINPLLQCEFGHEYIAKGSIAPFSPIVDSVINAQKDYRNITFASVYFRDLNNGPWFGINEDEKFRPASLLKVVVMMYYLRQEYLHPGTLGQTVVYNGEDFNLEPYYPPSKQVVKGMKYTLWDLIQYMIVYSDNRATAKLYNMIDDQKFMEIFGILGIQPPTSLDQQEFITIRQYASFFRILFNASYVGDILSEKALSLLNQAEFANGLRKGAPSDINVAHKFGEVTLDSGENQLHDCGIVYYPNKPYLLCVMTRGTDFPKMEVGIQAISKAVYDEVDRQVKGK